MAGGRQPRETRRSRSPQLGEASPCRWWLRPEGDMSPVGLGAGGEGVAGAEPSGHGDRGWAEVGVPPRTSRQAGCLPRPEGLDPRCGHSCPGLREAPGLPPTESTPLPCSRPHHAGPPPGYEQAGPWAFRSLCPEALQPGAGVVSSPLPGVLSGRGAALPRLHPHPCPACRPHCTRRSHSPATSSPRPPPPTPESGLTEMNRIT